MSESQQASTEKKTTTKRKALLDPSMGDGGSISKKGKVNDGGSSSKNGELREAKARTTTGEKKSATKDKKITNKNCNHPNCGKWSYGQDIPEACMKCTKCFRSAAGCIDSDCNGNCFECKSYGLMHQPRIIQARKMRDKAVVEWERAYLQQPDVQQAVTGIVTMHTLCPDGKKRAMQNAFGYYDEGVANIMATVAKEVAEEVSKKSP
eukprot:g6524.t1